MHGRRNDNPDRPGEHRVAIYDDLGEWIYSAHPWPGPEPQIAVALLIDYTQPAATAGCATHPLAADGTPIDRGRYDVTRIGEYAPILDLAIGAGLEIDPGRWGRSLRSAQVARWRSHARGLSWRDRARGVCQAVVADLGIWASDEEFDRAFRDAYPFGERAMHPYKVWLDQVKRTRRGVAAERKWAAATKGE